MIFVHDLGVKKLLGARKAVIDFCKNNQIAYVSIPEGFAMTAAIAKPMSYI